FVGVITSTTTNSTCPWRASSNASWITITSGSSSSGTGNVNYTVAGNSGAARQGTITIAGLTFTINQDPSRPPVLTSITVTPASASVAAGNTQQFSATGHYSDGSSNDITTSATWSSSNTGVATISNANGTPGLAKGIAAGGPVTITATSGNVSGTAQLT